MRQCRVMTVRLSGAMSNDVREDEESGKDNSGTSDIRFEDTEKQSRVGTVCRDAVDSHFESVTDSADGISTDVSARERGRKVRKRLEGLMSPQRRRLFPFAGQREKTKGKHSNPHHEPKSEFSNEVDTSIAIEPSALYEQFSKSVMAVQENQTSLAQQMHCKFCNQGYAIFAIIRNSMLRSGVGGSVGLSVAFGCQCWKGQTQSLRQSIAGLNPRNSASLVKHALLVKCLRRNIVFMNQVLLCTKHCGAPGTLLSDIKKIIKCKYIVTCLCLMQTEQNLFVRCQ